jgi:hypothetical protein
MRIRRRRPRGSARAPAPFLVGVPRSGTTLLRLMLDAHPELAIPPETHFVPALIVAAREGDSTPEGLVDLIEARPEWGDFGFEVDDLVERFRAAGTARPRAVLRAFYEAYAERHGKRRWGDKTPGHSAHMRRIARALPEAHFVHLLRDGRDVFNSRTKRRDVDPAQVAVQWRRGIQRARRQSRSLDHYLELRYEDLVAEPEPALRRICGFIDLGYDPAMLRHHERAEERLAEIYRDLPAGDSHGLRTAERRRDLHASASRPVDRDLVGAWRERMSAEQVAAFEREAGWLLGDLGYEEAAGKGPIPQT